jgi:glyoxylase-like metal-dependent hydrolase (beta-lactamase superfamily II)
MIRHTFPVGPFQCNCTILVDETSRDAIVIDPGWEPEIILAEVGRLRAQVKAIVHTHAHIDHVNGTREVHEGTGATVSLHEADLPLYENLTMQAALFGLAASAPLPVDRYLKDGDAVGSGILSLGVIHTPGHTPGSLCFRLLGSEPLLFTGDTLFRGSIGRTDLWGGSHPTILRSIRERLLTLDDDLVVIPGHGEESSIGFERSRNPFLT